MFSCMIPTGDEHNMTYKVKFFVVVNILCVEITPVNRNFAKVLLEIRYSY